MTNNERRENFKEINLLWIRNCWWRGKEIELIRILHCVIKWVWQFFWIFLGMWLLWIGKMTERKEVLIRIFSGSWNSLLGVWVCLLVYNALVYTLASYLIPLILCPPLPCSLVWGISYSVTGYELNPSDINKE